MPVEVKSILVCQRDIGLKSDNPQLALARYTLMLREKLFHSAVEVFTDVLERDDNLSTHDVPSILGMFGVLYRAWREYISNMSTNVRQSAKVYRAVLLGILA